MFVDTYITFLVLKVLLNSTKQKDKEEMIIINKIGKFKQIWVWYFAWFIQKMD